MKNSFRHQGLIPLEPTGVKEAPWVGGTYRTDSLLGVVEGRPQRRSMAAEREECFTAPALEVVPLIQGEEECRERVLRSDRPPSDRIDA
jgi:hypothetical protein